MYTYYSIFSVFVFLTELKLTLMKHCLESTQPKTSALDYSYHVLNFCQVLGLCSYKTVPIKRSKCIYFFINACFMCL